MMQDVSQQALPVMHFSRLDDAGRVAAGASCNACLSLDDAGRVAAGASCNASFPSG